VLPLGPTGYGDSPYQSLSAFAGNPILINLDTLVEDELLDARDLADAPEFSNDLVDYGLVINFKNRILEKAHRNFNERGPEEAKAEYASFLDQTGWWLEDYALYRSIKDRHSGQEWTRWEPYLRSRENNSIHFWRENHEIEIDRHKFYQYLFFKQWLRLAHYANGKGIKIIGDLPIFVAHDSADVWASPHLFHLDAEGKPTLVAGVPPDYFSETGQLWGNPLYRWELMKKDGYQWWINRLRATLSMVDIVRLDHFRGFEKYWAVPGNHETAIHGKWKKGPGADLFKTIKTALGSLPIIAENLGYITPEVEVLREKFGFPGMRILQFAFGTDLQSDQFKPYNFTQNTVVYTGTHDNDTTIGWFTSDGAANSTRSEAEVKEEREFVLKYLGTDGKNINWDFIRLALCSVANTVIIPLQDVLGLGSEARVNIPGRESGNWTWRFRAEQLTPEIRWRLAELTAVYGRE